MEKESTLMDFDKDQIGEEIELPSFALKYANVKTKIEKVEIHKGGVFDGRQSYYLKYLTAIVGKEKIKNKETNKEEVIEIRATKVFGIRYENGKYNWSSQSLLGKFLRKRGLKNFNEAVGLSVVTSPEEKDEKTYLSFI